MFRPKMEVPHEMVHSPRVALALVDVSLQNIPQLVVVAAVYYLERLATHQPPNIRVAATRISA
jgi:hypothetical protein